MCNLIMCVRHSSVSCHLPLNTSFFKAVFTLWWKVTQIWFFHSYVCDPYLPRFWQCEQHMTRWIWHFWVRIRALANVAMTWKYICFLFFFWGDSLNSQVVLWYWRHSAATCHRSKQRRRLDFFLLFLHFNITRSLIFQLPPHTVFNIRPQTRLSAAIMFISVNTVLYMT